MQVWDGWSERSGIRHRKKGLQRNKEAQRLVNAIPDILAEGREAVAGSTRACDLFNNLQFYNDLQFGPEFVAGRLWSDM
jgi:hypothetical protein